MLTPPVARMATLRSAIEHVAPSPSAYAAQKELALPLQAEPRDPARVLQELDAFDSPVVPNTADARFGFVFNLAVGVPRQEPEAASSSGTPSRCPL